jgi:hypothetical protein
VAAAERERGGGGTSVAAGARAWRWGPEHERGGGRSTSSGQWRPDQGAAAAGARAWRRAGRRPSATSVAPTARYEAVGDNLISDGSVRGRRR